MKVISVHSRLKLALAALLTVVPLAAFEVILLTNSNLYKLPSRALSIWCSAVALIGIPLAYWMSRGKKTAFHFTVLFAAFWVMTSAAMSFRYRNPSAGFYTLFVALYWVLELIWLKVEMSRSFFDPKMEWFQGSPAPISGLNCELGPNPEKRVAWTVSRIDEDGLFIVNQRREEGSFLTQKSPIELVLTYRDRQVRCKAVPMTALYTNQGQAVGAGLKFNEMAADQTKELGDFVESLRGEGHA